jgi:MFS family permease
MRAKSTAAVEHGIERPDLCVAWLCGVVAFLEGYDIAAAGYAIPSLVEAWRLAPSAFTQALTAGNVGLLLGSIGAGLLGDQLGRKPMLIGCVARRGRRGPFSLTLQHPTYEVDAIPAASRPCRAKR